MPRHLRLPATHWKHPHPEPPRPDGKTNNPEPHHANALHLPEYSPHRPDEAPAQVSPLPDKSRAQQHRQESVRHRFLRGEHASCCGIPVQRSHYQISIWLIHCSTFMALQLFAKQPYRCLKSHTPRKSILTDFSQSDKLFPMRDALQSRLLHSRRRQKQFQQIGSVESSPPNLVQL